jgi:hypothetical protein
MRIGRSLKVWDDINLNLSDPLHNHQILQGETFQSLESLQQIISNVWYLSGLMSFWALSIVGYYKEG